MKPNKDTKTWWDAVGGLSKTQKMPWWSYGHTAGLGCPGMTERCRNTMAVCAKCYAKKGRYRFGDCAAANKKRYDIVSRFGNHPEEALDWSVSMSKLLAYLADGEAQHCRFRWHDCGDVMSVPHFHAIRNVAQSVPQVDFWLPTQNAEVLESVLHGLDLPQNLVIRYGLPNWRYGWADLPSRHPEKQWLDRPRMLMDPKYKALDAAIADGLVLTTEVVAEYDCTTCPATMGYAKTCESAGCHQCWNPRIPHVKYRLH